LDILGMLLALEFFYLYSCNDFSQNCTIHYSHFIQPCYVQELGGTVGWSSGQREVEL
jgi:hypothetical protein